MKWVSSFLLFFAPLYCFSHIQTIHSIAEMDMFVKGNNQKLVAFDIDDTLTILSDPAFHRPNFKIHHATLFVKLMEPFSPEERMLAFTLPLLTTSGDLIEKEAPHFLAKLQKQKNIKTVALTAAMGGKIDGVSIEDRRFAELKRVGIDFSFSFPNLAETVFIDFRTPLMGSLPLFKNGIIFTNENDKGEVLVKFLKTIPWKPDEIIFVDDRIEHLQAVEKALHLSFPEIAFTGLHFKTNPAVYKNTDAEQFSKVWLEHAKKAQQILRREIH